MITIQAEQIFSVNKVNNQQEFVDIVNYVELNLNKPESMRNCYLTYSHEIKTDTY
jgi:hypothetical protein